MATVHKIILAGGCFWGMQALIDAEKGVVETRVGYCGGKNPDVGYEQVKTGSTGHAESIEILFDSSVVSLRSLLALFFKIHDPTTVDRQGNDRGSQYRSAIFYTTEEQRIASEKAIADADATGLWGAKIVTQVLPFYFFVEAEPNHQKYIEQNPDGYTCHFPRADWILPE